MICCVYAHAVSGPNVLDGQTKERCRVVSALYHRDPRLNHYILIATAVKQEEKWVGEAMKNHLTGQGVPAKQIIFQPSGYTTIDETNAFLTIIRQCCLQPSAPIIVISTWYHLPRIWWLWLVRGKAVKIAASWKGASFIDLLLEPFKLLINLFLPFYVPRWL